MKKSEIDRINRVAQWAFDTQPILGRFHLWLEDVQENWIRGDKSRSIHEEISFVDGRMERLFVMTAAVTALGTRLFGRYGEGRNAEKKELNQVKKDADAISAYAMSESLWYLSRWLPENHAIMVCLGEGLMPKVGETPEMGSNPMLGFGRIYARPQVAKFLDARVHRLINDDSFTWEDFHTEVKNEGITIWGAAIDTLENTTRFAKGGTTGPVTVLHLFDQPLAITKPYEGYIGNLVIPKAVEQAAAERSLLVHFFTPRSKVMEAIRWAYPEIRSENIHIWTLGGKSRESRIGSLWEEWRRQGVHIVEEGWTLPGGLEAFTESGTYAPTFQIGTWRDAENTLHLFIVDGYAASAEAIQAASLCPILGLEASLAIFTSRFTLSYEKEARIMHLDPSMSEFKNALSDIFGERIEERTVEECRENILLARKAGIPLERRIATIDDFFPEKNWRVMAVSGYMLTDPYTNTPGVKEVKDRTYEVAVRISTKRGDKSILLTLRLEEDLDSSRLIFNPLLNRFLHGENYRERAVKISDSGRIRNELQTLCSEALEYVGDAGIRIQMNKISEDIVSPENQKKLADILRWYKENHPIWFKWLEIR